MNKNLQAITTLSVSALFSARRPSQANPAQALKRAVTEAALAATDIRAKAALVTLGEHLDTLTGNDLAHPRFCTRCLLRDWTPSPSWEGPSPDGEWFGDYRDRMVKEALLGSEQVKVWAHQTLPSLLERAGTA